MEELAGRGPRAQQLIVVGEFFLDWDTIRVWRGNRPIRFSFRQFQIMDYFMRNAGKAVSLKDLKEAIWGPESAVQDTTLTVEIARIRHAIGGRGDAQPIRTVRKSGYVFEISKPRKSSKPRQSTRLAP